MLGGGQGNGCVSERQRAATVRRFSEVRKQRAHSRIAWGDFPVRNGMIVSHLWRTGKRAVAIASIGLMVAILAVPETSLAASQQAPSGIHQFRPSDGVGDSPTMP